MSAIPHIGFIVAAYAIAAVAVAAMIGAIFLDHRDLTKQLSALEAQRDEARAP